MLAGKIEENVPEVENWGKYQNGDAELIECTPVVFWDLSVRDYIAMIPF